MVRFGFTDSKDDSFVKRVLSAVPANAGMANTLISKDSGFRRNDVGTEPADFSRMPQGVRSWVKSIRKAQGIIFLSWEPNTNING